MIEPKKCPERKRAAGILARVVLQREFDGD